ncbi:MAG: 30S ribosomal protein S4 [Candidatus Omnitrophica bacterium]|nr:30S ribosomal protein S4 [Candidatus Omnitrophota bacterium]
MARHTGSVCRLCRREGVKLFLKGTRCHTDKCAITRREYAPGLHGKVRKKRSDYGTQLREKQKVKRIYGLLETQFRNIFRSAARTKGVTGELLLSALERRLDNCVYRLNLAASRAQARQMVRHGFVHVNGRAVSIPSYLVSQKDRIEIKAKEQFLKAVKERLESWKDRPTPAWLKLDPAALTGEVLARPTRADVGGEIQEQLIVELYSK